MKNVFIKSLGLVLALSACQKENSEIGYSDIEEPVSISFSSQISRVVGTQWEDYDEVGISATDGNSVNYTNVKYLSDASGNFSVPKGGEPICYQNQNAMSFTAYYPYSETASEGVISGNTISNQEDCNFLWAQAYSSTPIVNFTFNHSMAELRIELTYPKGTNVDAYKNVTISGLKHDGNFNINTGVAIPNAEAAQDWNIALSEEGTTALSFKGVIFPQAVSGMVLKMNGVDYNINFKDTEEFKAGKYYTISAEINADCSVKVSMKVNGATIDDYKDGGNAKIAFLGTADSEQYLGNEEQKAYEWLKTINSNVDYISVTYSGDLSGYDLIWAHFQAEQFEVNVNESMKTYYANGGRILATQYATMSVDSWDIVKDGIQPNNAWDPEVDNGAIGVGIVAYHPIFNGLLGTNDYLNLHETENQTTFKSRCFQWRTVGGEGGEYDGNRYPDLSTWRTKTGGRNLASDNNGVQKERTVRIAEFGSQVTPDVKGSAIVIGDTGYLWKDIELNKLSDNIRNLTKNTIEYLLNL